MHGKSKGLFDLQECFYPGRCPLVERSLGLNKITKLKKAWIMVNNVLHVSCVPCFISPFMFVDESDDSEVEQEIGSCQCQCEST